jgi:hypothetical protein
MIPSMPSIGGYGAQLRHNARLLVLALTLFALASPGLCHEAAPPVPQAGRSATAKALTQSLIAGHGAYREARTAERQQRLDELLAIAAERREVLLALIESNPGEALRLALPEALSAGMPGEVQEYVEHWAEWEGALQVLYEDYEDPRQSRHLHFLETGAGERLSLHFAGGARGFLTGARVWVRGVSIDNAVALENGETSILTLEARGGAGGNGDDAAPGALPNTLGEQKTLVLLVNFQDKPDEQPWTVEEARSAVFGQVSDFFMENSYHQTWLSGDVHGWFTISQSSTVCDIHTLASQAQSAASATGVNLSAYNHYVYAFPKNGCGGNGAGTVGGNPSQAWINGTLDLIVVGHELGHNLGLYHAKALDCSTAVVGTNCTVMAYGDPFDTMGNSDPGHFSAFHKERLGWLNTAASPAITMVLTDGTYPLETYEFPGAGPNALKILKSTDPSTGQRTWYYVESRQAIGFDAFLADNANVLNGVLVHIGTEGDGDSSYLLDTTPGSGTLNAYDWRDPALAAVQSLEDPDTGTTITTDWVSTSGAAVTVRVGANDGYPTNESTVTVSTDRPSYSRRETVTMTVNVTSRGSPVADARLNFTITNANGAVVTANTTTGTDGVAVYKLRLKNKDPLGIYQVAAAAETDANSGSAATAFTVTK